MGLSSNKPSIVLFLVIVLLSPMLIANETTKFSSDNTPRREDVYLHGKSNIPKIQAVYCLPWNKRGILGFIVQRRHIDIVEGDIICILEVSYIVPDRNKIIPPTIFSANVSAGTKRLTISFRVEGEEQTRTNITVYPVKYLFLQEAGFSQESPKSVNLNGSGNYTVSIPVSGGREYQVIINSCIHDMCNKTVLRTPYVREYEDLAEQLAEKGIVLSTTYMPWDMKNILREN
ncbi:hypothetical protein [Pyrococcus furiosus]|nr:hypothetical protein [Pyrococcus furiosus]